MEVPFQFACPQALAPEQLTPVQTSMNNHQYGHISAGGNSRMQVGDATYNTSSVAQLLSPIASNSIMTVNYYQPTRNSHYDMSNTDPLTTLKQILYYPSMEVRTAQLASIEAASFDWIWTDTNFPHFLQSVESLFWIQGRPASGKSTLMHYLSSASLVKRTIRDHLQDEERKIQVVHFFFDFRASTGTANTPTGMLRAVLLQLVCDVPLIAEAILKQVAYRLDGDWQNLPEEMINILSEALKTTNVYLLGLIDGPDEYNGSFSSLIHTIFAMKDRCNIKLCLASRPEPEIQFKLRRIPGFSMQTFNNATIVTYVDKRCVDLEAYVDNSDLIKFIKWIQVHAEGVILWARFAYDELTYAVLRGESPDEIWHKLRGYSSDLKDMYNRIWQGIEQKDRIHAAVAFHLVDQWHQMPTESANLTWIHGYQTDAIELDDFFVRWSEITSKLDLTAKGYQRYDLRRFKLRMTSLLSGLLVFTNDHRHVDEHPGGSGGTSVSLLHRTVRPFLDECKSYQEIIDFVISKTGPIPPLGVFYSTVVKEMATHLEPEENRPLPGTRMDWLLKCVCGDSCRIFKRLCLQNALKTLFRLAYMDLPKYVTLFRSAVRSWLFQIFGYFPEGTIGPQIPQDSIMRRYMEVVSFITARYCHAFIDYIREYQDHMTSLDWDILCRHLICSIRFKFSKLSKNSDLIAQEIFEHVAPAARY